MCGRFVQDRSVADYVDWLGVRPAGEYDDVPLQRYNIAPTAMVSVFHGSPEGMMISAIKWGWQPHWATGKRPPPINARVETVATNRFFKDVWPHRVLVPATGWYEWVPDVNDPKRKQPYFIHLKTGEPMFLAGVGVEGEGVVILTADAEGGMVDLHDRPPIVLPPGIALEWMNPDTDQRRAAEIMLAHATPSEAFTWYPVGKAVGNVRNQGAQLTLPLID